MSELSRPKAITVPDTHRYLYIFHVPRSSARPHLPSRTEERFFWKRTNSGCERMTLEEIRAVFLNYEDRRRQLQLLLAELLSIRNDLAFCSTAPVDKMLIVRPNVSELFRLVPDIYPLIEGDAEFLELLISIRTWVKHMAAEEEVWLARVAAQTETPSEFWVMHRKQMHHFATKGMKHIDVALEILTTRYNVVNPLIYTKPRSDIVANLIAAMNDDEGPFS